MLDKINNIDMLPFAKKHCNKGEFDCSWYHGNWHLLKQLGLVSTSAVHEQSIGKLLQLAMSGMNTPRILLTGSTDETLVRLVHATCQAMGITEQLHAVDLCATPLAFMQMYAEENNIPLQTNHSNILDFETDSKFDIILTHAFMGYFDDKQRPLLLKKWQQLLSEPGKIVTIQRIRPANSPKQITFTAEQASCFTIAAIEAAKKSRFDTHNNDDSEHNIWLNTVKTAAMEFTNNFSNYSITSSSDLESLFTDSGLAFKYLEYHHLAQKGNISGPSVPSDAEFAHIIAENISQGAS